MARSSRKTFGAKMRPVDLSAHWNWPRRTPKGETFLAELAERARAYASGAQAPWGVAVEMAGESGPRVVLLAKGKPEVEVRLRGAATHLCFVHEWAQIPETVRRDQPREGLVVGEYEIEYADGTRHALPVRARFEVRMIESPGPTWRAVGFEMHRAIDPAAPPGDEFWGRRQHGFAGQTRGGPLLCPMENPFPEKRLRSVTLRGLQESPLLVAGLTLYEGSDSPVRHLPRRTYRVHAPGGPAKVESAEVDLGVVTRVEQTTGPRGKRWLESKDAGTSTPDPDRGAEDLIEVVAARDAELSVTLAGRRSPMRFSVGEAFEQGKSASGRARLEALGQRRQWMRVTIVDASTGRPTPARVHFSGARGEYLAPYGHHAQVNPNWFEDYGADVIVGGRNYAYVPGEFNTDMPVGDVFVEVTKGFEYTPLRAKVTIRPGQRELKLKVRRWTDLRSEGWVTADTHVHFLSPQTAWLEAQAEGVNVVNLLASQWGRLFTNVGDISGKPNVVEDDTIVFVGTENRNHMLGHMSMLGTRDLPVFPMCCGGVGESFIGDPDFRMLAEWATENRAKGGVVVRPHFPNCGFTEDPVPILAGLVDALEVRVQGDENFATQEWYRYLNCGYRVAVCGGTDKMSATVAVGSLRTYALLDPNRRFTYAAWAKAVRAGRTVSTTGPLLDLQVEGRGIGETIDMPAGGGTVEFNAEARCFAPLRRVEIVVNGRVVARATGAPGATKLRLRGKAKITGSGWIAARCSGRDPSGGLYGAMAAHTSPVYLRCGDQRAFDGPAAEHMLTLVEGGIEYLNKLATVFDESSRKRMVKLFNEARRELKGRLIVEAPHGGHGHTHGPGVGHHHHH